MTERLRVAVPTGGPSAEHEVSPQSAQAVLDALPRDLYEPTAIIIDRQGRWPVAEGLNAAGRRSRGRLEIHERPDGVTVVDDAHNADPESMRAGLRTLKALAGAT
ncbi:glutamate ligase domain-containing protein [Nonomuraea sp. SYSU D8015]|uniref:glutamate ligase domain-containing protein n=1 Tax=Nonomuraea sp. SYSU D8015 TaxID=2593644 RepID=UPI0016603B7E|nr:cyanophycin synthetase [Nonomuraea sp. SYSU D8015]